MAFQKSPSASRLLGKERPPLYAVRWRVSLADQGWVSFSERHRKQIIGAGLPRQRLNIALNIVEELFLIDKSVVASRIFKHLIW